MVISAQETIAKKPAAGRAGPTAAMPAAGRSPGTATTGAAHGADAFAPSTVDWHRWTGSVETQQREGKRFLALLVLAVVLLIPFAVWLSLYLSRVLSL